jgi:hypothetical protein
MTKLHHEFGSSHDAARAASAASCERNLQKPAQGALKLNDVG